jgi:hypothetical protein
VEADPELFEGEARVELKDISKLILLFAVV